MTPFLDNGIQFAWDSTSLGWLKECPRKYYYAMVEGWKHKTEAVNLIWGQWYHYGLEYYDKARALNLSHDDAVLDMVAVLMKITWIDGKPWVSDHASKTRENLIRSVVWYCDHFADDPAKTVILANGKPAVELSFKMELDWSPTSDAGPYILCGHIDRLVDYAGGVYDMDRKTTTSTVASNYFDQYDPDNQMSLYTLATKVIYETPVKGVIIDAAQIAVGFTRFSRGFTYRTDTQIEEWRADLHYWFAMQKEFASAKYWPMNDKSCHKFGGCHFRKVCSRSPEVRHVFLNSDFERKPWNPLVPR